MGILPSGQEGQHTASVVSGHVRMKRGASEVGVLEEPKVSGRRRGGKSGGDEKRDLHGVQFVMGSGGSDGEADGGETSEAGCG